MPAAVPAVIAAPSAGMPVQPVTPVNDVVVVPVYVQVPVMPAPVNVPFVCRKPKVDATFSVVVAERSWPAPLTVVDGAFVSWK